MQPERAGQYILQRETQHLIEEIERLRGLLARLEWASLCDGGARDCGTCPVCYGHKDGRRHSPDCWLAEELAGEWPIRDE